MSAFEKAGYLRLAGSTKSVKISIDGKIYFVGAKDVLEAIKNPTFAAQIVRLVKPTGPEIGGYVGNLKTDSKPKLDFSLNLSGVSP